MVPGHPRVLAKMLTTRRFTDPPTPPRSPATSTAALPAGASTTSPPSSTGRRTPARRSAISTSCSPAQSGPACRCCPTLRQPTLVVAGTDDPIVSVVNAHILNRLLPHSRLHLHDGGHLELTANAPQLALVIDTFLREPGRWP